MNFTYIYIYRDRTLVFYLIYYIHMYREFWSSSVLSVLHAYEYIYRGTIYCYEFLPIIYIWIFDIIDIHIQWCICINKIIYLVIHNINIITIHIKEYQFININIITVHKRKKITNHKHKHEWRFININKTNLPVKTLRWGKSNLEVIVPPSQLPRESSYWS